MADLIGMQPNTGHRNLSHSSCGKGSLSLELPNVHNQLIDPSIAIAVKISAR